MFSQNNQLSFPLANFEFIFDFNNQNKLIALAFLIIAAVTGLYAISQNRKFEVLIGSLYWVSSLACLFAGDYFYAYLPRIHDNIRLHIYFLW
jgi:multicomponent Na+:H+ antiporter subunit D